MLTHSKSEPHVKRLFLFLFLSLVTGGCTTRIIANTEMAGMAPMLSVERFLQATSSGDFVAMARIFGGKGGPIADTGGTFGCMFKKLGSWIGMGARCLKAHEVELRMSVIALVLRHDDYEIVGQSLVPGRVSPTTRIGVTLTRAGRRYEDVPFLVVQLSEGRWLIEEIGLTTITGQ